MSLPQKIKRLFVKQKPIDWFDERKSIGIYRRDGAFRNTMAHAILAIPEVHDPVCIVEYIDRYCIEVMVSISLFCSRQEAISKVVDAIYSTKAMGILTLGNQKVTILGNGFPYEISFTELTWMEDY